MALWQRLELDLEEERRAIPGGPQGWRPERLILRDWWHWRDQEFGFAHGRLALTGQNAGGKSSLLALAIPVLLDGRTEPARLDPAQSRDRFLHYYLLGADGAEAGNPDVFRYEARTGYIALEFYHTADQRFLTIGMGVSASRSSPRRITDWWGFLLVKGQRLGRDSDVRGADGTCLGRREFARLVGDGGIVVTEKAEYQRLVNDYLFGFEGDDFDALIAMLLQARRPKLGEQAGPDKVCDLLRRSLPGISPDRLSRVGEVVNNIEEYRRNLADVTEKAEAVGRVGRGPVRPRGGAGAGGGCAVPERTGLPGRRRRQAEGGAGEPRGRRGRPGRAGGAGAEPGAGAGGPGGRGGGAPAGRRSRPAGPAAGREGKSLPGGRPRGGAGRAPQGTT